MSYILKLIYFRHDWILKTKTLYSTSTKNNFLILILNDYTNVKRYNIMFVNFTIVGTIINVLQ